MKAHSWFRAVAVAAAITAGLSMLPGAAQASVEKQGGGGSGGSTSGNTAVAPELDPSVAMGALTLLGFGLSVVRGRDKGK